MGRSTFRAGQPRRGGERAVSGEYSTTGPSGDRLDARVLDRKARVLPGPAAAAARGRCRFTHGDFVEPGQFGYIIEPDEALANFRATRSRCCSRGTATCRGSS
jgi:hypothetical protein